MVVVVLNLAVLGTAGQTLESDDLQSTEDGDPIVDEEECIQVASLEIGLRVDVDETDGVDYHVGTGTTGDACTVTLPLGDPTAMPTPTMTPIPETDVDAHPNRDAEPPPQQRCRTPSSTEMPNPLSDRDAHGDADGTP